MFASLLLVLGVGCDPPDLFGTTGDPPPPKADPAKQAAEAAAAEVAAAKEAKEAEAKAFAVCMAGCIGPEANSPTDRQTCRLSCGADQLDADGPGPSAATRAALGRFEGCLEGCAPGPGTDAATCRLTCAQSAMAGQGPQALDEPQRGCSVSCLEHAGECEAQCEGSPDDVATCRLQCTGLGERCLERCRDDPEAAAKARAAPPPPAPAAPEPPAKVSIPKSTAERLPAPADE
ncbi:MAG: hypothetical protein AB1Z98_04190 [Nannocystaceae bacterium]